MSLENHLTAAMQEAIDNGEADYNEAELSAREVRLLLREPAIRSEVYEKASLDPIVGDDMNMSIVHAVLDSLIGALE